MLEKRCDLIQSHGVHLISLQILWMPLMKYLYFTVIRWIPRVLAFALSVNFYLDMTGPTMVPASERFSLKYLLHTGSLCLASNIGMWLSSTNWLRNRKVFLLILHVPSVFLALSLVNEFGSVVYLGIFLTLACYVILYRYGDRIHEDA
jgi:hypothetical protein